MKDGGYRRFVTRRQKMPNGDHMVTMRDVTEERRRTDELEEGRRTRQLLGEAAGIGTWTFEPLENRIHWSDDLLTLTGYSADQVRTAEDFARVLHPSEYEMIRDALARAARSGEGGRLEHRMKVGGRWRSWRVTFRTEPRAQGVFALKGISEDITELVAARDAARKGEHQMRKAQLEAQAAASRLKLALQAAEAGVYEIDHVAKTFWASPEFQRLTGKSDSS